MSDQTNTQPENRIPPHQDEFEGIRIESARASKAMYENLDEFNIKRINEEVTKVLKPYFDGDIAPGFGDINAACTKLGNFPKVYRQLKTILAENPWLAGLGYGPNELETNYEAMKRLFLGKFQASKKFKNRVTRRIAGDTRIYSGLINLLNDCVTKEGEQ